MSALTFKLRERIAGTFGRTGIITTPHGDIHTPAFSPVGTKASVKSLTPVQLKELGAQAVLANTYHLYLSGPEIVEGGGGVGAFMGWDGPTITDSGGFQAFSLGSAFGAGINKFITNDEREFFENEKDGTEPSVPSERLAHVMENGVAFRSHRDGSSHMLTPETSVRIQHKLGADIMFVLDELSGPTDSYDHQKEALDRTYRWAQRCLDEHQSVQSAQNTYKQALFGIVQGGSFEDLRREASRSIGALAFDGFGVGGSYTREEMADILRWSVEGLPESKPRHLLGIGSEPRDFFIGVENGADLFDCVAPTRLARNGSLYTYDGKINILNSAHRRDYAPLENECNCYTCRNFSRAYVAHLFRSKEILANTLATIHNVRFITNLMANIRKAIQEGDFFEYRDAFLSRYENNTRNKKLS